GRGIRSGGSVARPSLNGGLLAPFRIRALTISRSCRCREDGSSRIAHGARKVHTRGGCIHVVREVLRSALSEAGSPARSLGTGPSRSQTGSGTTGRPTGPQRLQVPP